jgi:DNA-binding NtrC family response regulator
MACLRDYSYPGNIRELRNILERALLLADGDELSCNHLPAICPADTTKTQSAAPQFTQLLPLESLEQHYLRWALANHQGDKRSLAQKLGISERTLYRKLERAL